MKKTGSPNFSGSLQVLSNSLLKNCIKLRFYHKCKHNERIVLLFINMRGAWSLVDSTCSRILKSSSKSSHYYFPPIFLIFSRALIYISCTHIFIIHPTFWMQPPNNFQCSQYFKNLQELLYILILSFSKKYFEYLEYFEEPLYILTLSFRSTVVFPINSPPDYTDTESYLFFPFGMGTIMILICKI